jgi:cytoskeletal protein RodZ
MKIGNYIFYSLFKKYSTIVGISTKQLYEESHLIQRFIQYKEETKLDRKDKEEVKLKKKRQLPNEDIKFMVSFYLFITYYIDERLYLCFCTIYLFY